MSKDTYSASDKVSLASISIAQMAPIDQAQANLHPYTMVWTLVDPGVAAPKRMMLTGPPTTCRKETHQDDSKHSFVLPVRWICHAVWM